MGDKVDLTNYVDSKVPQDEVIPRKKVNSENTSSVTVDDHTNASTIGTEVNSQVLLPPHLRAVLAAGRSVISTSTIATSTVTTNMNTSNRDENIGASLGDTFVFDINRLRSNCRNSYSKEEINEYDSDSDDGSYEDMSSLIDRGTGDCSDSSFSEIDSDSDDDDETFLSPTFTHSRLQGNRRTSYTQQELDQY